MNRKLFGLVAIMAPLLGTYPAAASTFVYNVDYTIPDGSTPETVTGSITTNCDSNCAITSTSVTAFSLTMAGPTGPATIVFDAGSTDHGILTNVSFGDLVASSTGILWTPTGGEQTVFYGDNSVGTIGFDTSPTANPFPTAYEASKYATFPPGVNAFCSSGCTLEIATMSATPLPAALPLFATALGFGGLLGWRRKRKASATAAA